MTSDEALRSAAVRADLSMGQRRCTSKWLWMHRAQNVWPHLVGQEHTIMSIRSEEASMVLLNKSKFWCEKNFTINCKSHSGLKKV